MVIAASVTRTGSSSGSGSGSGADSGSGIKKENLVKINDPFFTTKSPGAGVGLGLSITYSIIQEHKGKIKVNSKIDEGTTFIITLPK